MSVEVYRGPALGRQEFIDNNDDEENRVKFSIQVNDGCLKVMRKQYRKACSYIDVFKVYSPEAWHEAKMI